MNKNDMRYKKTEQLIRNAFINEIMAGSIYNLKVKTICEKANISRKTFYDHYSDIFDLAVRTCCLKVELNSGDRPVDIFAFVNRISTDFNQSVIAKLSEVELTPDTVHFLFQNQIRLIYDCMIKTGFTPKYDEQNKVLYILAFISSGFSGAYKEWYDKPKNNLNCHDFILFMTPWIAQNLAFLFEDG